MLGERLIWPRKRGSGPAPEGGLASGRRAAVHRLDAAAAVPAAARDLARTGTQAMVPITGANAKRVLFGAIDLRTAHRTVLIRRHAGQADAQAFLSELRRRYPRGADLGVADRTSAHTAPQHWRAAQLASGSSGCQAGPELSSMTALARAQEPPQP